MMVSRLMKLARAYREKILSLVILPAFFFGTLPHTACICADGHREEHCRAMTIRLATPPSPVRADCSCRKNATPKAKHRSCCLTKQNLNQPGSKLVSANGSCCRPIVEPPAPTVPGAKGDQIFEDLFAAAIESSASWWSSETERPKFEPTQNSTPPPLDAVIVYLHLTI